MRRVNNRADCMPISAVQLVGTAKGNNWRLNAGEKLRKEEGRGKREERRMQSMTAAGKRSQPISAGWGARDLDDAMMRWY